MNHQCVIYEDYANQNNFERAKECYKEACIVDVKCYEAFNELIMNNLMTPNEEWEFVMTQLNFRDNLDDTNNDELIKLLYMTKLSKYLNRINSMKVNISSKKNMNYMTIVI